MILAWLSVLAGLALLVGGGELLVRGASGIALLARVTPTVVGLTVVAAGTSMPELVVSAQSALEGATGMAAGNVVGSNLFNIGATLGLAAMLRPLAIQGSTVRLEWPVLMLGALQLYLLCRDGTLDRVEGAVMTAALAAFVGYATFIALRATTPKEQEGYADMQTASFGRTGAVAWAFNIGAVVGGGLLLVAGSTVLVGGATTIAQSLGVSDTVIGLTVVAAGTSAPEMAASLVAAWRGKDDIAVANVVGSNIFNTLGILGLTALVKPLPIPPEIITRDLLWMVGMSAVLFPMMRSGMRVVRLEGALLLGAYVTYTALLIQSA